MWKRLRKVPSRPSACTVSLRCACCRLANSRCSRHGQEGNSVMALVTDFLPYFYVAVPRQCSTWHDGTTLSSFHAYLNVRAYPLFNKFPFMTSCCRRFGLAVLFPSNWSRRSRSTVMVATQTRRSGRSHCRCRRWSQRFEISRYRCTHAAFSLPFHYPSLRKTRFNSTATLVPNARPSNRTSATTSVS